MYFFINFLILSPLFLSKLLISNFLKSKGGNKFFFISFMATILSISLYLLFKSSNNLLYKLLLFFNSSSLSFFSFSPAKVGYMVKTLFNPNFTGALIPLALNFS